MSQYEKLLEELETMAKAMPGDEGADDDKIQAAAAAANPDADGDGENDVTGDDLNPEGLGDEGEGEGDGDDEETMGKSFALKLEDGTELEAIDGTELVKSLMARVESNEGTVMKALGTAVDLLGKQGNMIKSLQDEVKKLAGEGRGRKTVVSVSEKPVAGATMAKSQGAADGLSANEFMAKALAAQASGRLTGLDVARAESALNKGLPVPQDVVNRVIQ
ncbi:MAG: hypothetical protein E6Q97_34575 [Desulfurellales bacterium]|nr:MAG: hypothetical protein E6Q97_34575 [Desulfurellales bacterium]